MHVHMCRHVQCTWGHMCSAGSADLLESWRVELERAVTNGTSRGLDLGEHARHVHAAVIRDESPEAPRGFLELARGGDRPAAAGLVPRHRHVDEALVEVALRGLRGAPDE